MVALIRRHHMGPSSSVPTGHQYCVLQWYPLYGLHEPSHYEWTVTVVGVLVIGAGPQPSWVH